MRTRHPLIFVTAAALGVVIACRDATQIIVEVRLRGAACAEARSATVAITRDDTAEAQLSAVSTESCDAATQFVGSLTAVPEGNGDSGKVFVRVVIGFSRPAETCSLVNGYDGCAVARRRVTYRPHALVRLPIYVDRICENQPCTTRTTCNQMRVCENADLETCDSEVCVLPSERGPALTAPDGRAGASIDASTEAEADAGSRSTTGDGGTGRASNSGPGVVCGGSRCQSPLPFCSLPGTCANMPMSGGSLECDESSDCAPQQKCCFDAAASRSVCQTTTQCSEAELCWDDRTCGGGRQCLNTTPSPLPYGACRAMGAGTNVACTGSFACVAPAVCHLNGAATGHFCNPDGTGPIVSCNGSQSCGTSAACVLREFTGYRRAGCGASGSGVADLCDGAVNSCPSGKTCSNELAEVQYGYYLRVCR